MPTSHSVNWIGVIPFALVTVIFVVALKTGRIHGALPIIRFDRSKNAPDYWAAMFVALLLVLLFAAVAFVNVRCAFHDLCHAS